MLFTPTQPHHGSPATPSDRPTLQPVDRWQAQRLQSSSPNLKRLAAIAIVLWASVATTIATQPQNENLTSLTWLLAHQKWSVASEVTWQILAPTAPDHTLQTEHCNLILEIDRLWTHYSGGRYGFGAQERVWDSLASGQSATQSATQSTTQPATRNRSISDRIQQFRQRVGWTANRASAAATPKPIGAFPTEAPWPTDPHQPLLCGDRTCTPSPSAISATYPSLGIIQMFDRCLEQSPQF